MNKIIIRMVTDFWGNLALQKFKVNGRVAKERKFYRNLHTHRWIGYHGPTMIFNYDTFTSSDK